MMSLSVRAEAGPWRRARPLLGTLVEITVSGPQPAYPEAAFEAAFAVIARVHDLMSWHDAGSDVGRINRAASGHWLPIDAWTGEVLRAAQMLFARSGGLFDVTCERHLRRAGILPDALHPDPERGGGMADLMLDEGGCRVRLDRPLSINLDGIAKGYAVDRAVAVLQDHGVAGGCVNAGGDLRLFGSSEQEVGLRNPHRPAEIIHLGRYCDHAVATTGGYFLDSGLDVASAVIDPASGLAVALPGSITVTAPCCMHADALTKIAALRRPDDDLVDSLFQELQATVHTFSIAGAEAVQDDGEPRQ